MSARILLVDDHEIMRQGLVALLRKHSDYQIVGQASDGRSALTVLKETSPDIVIMDIEMPNLNGIDAARQMIASTPDIKVLALSTYSRRSMVVQMLEAGASGYMLKDSAFTELIQALQALSEGRIYLCNKIAKVVFKDYVKMLTNPNWAGGDGLTSREREVLQLVAEGNTTKEIANILHLSVKTVDTHREHVMEKLCIHNVAGLTKYAVREGLTSP